MVSLAIRDQKFFSGAYAYKTIVGRTEVGKPVFTKALTGKLYEQTADYICSAYINENGQKVAYVIPLDIDAKEKSTSKRWLDSTGRVEWQKVVGFLQKKYPGIFQFLLFVVRSTGGRGIHLGIAISPIVKGFSEQMRRAEFLARQLQKNLLRLLNFHGIGADWSACGVDRDLPNWRRLQKPKDSLSQAVQLDYNPFIRARIKREKIDVISELLAITNKLPECQVPAKKDRDDVIHRSSKTEPGLAALYLHLYENFGSSVFMSMGELKKLTGLSKNSLRNVLHTRPHTCPKWLKVRHISREEGYEIWLDANFGSVERAEALVQGRFIESEFLSELPCPSQVVPGGRNQWMFSALIHLKWHGFDEKSALEIVKTRAKLIPTYKESNSYKRLDKIAAGIFSNYYHTRGIREDEKLPQALSKGHFERVKKLQQPPGGVLPEFHKIIRISFTRRDKNLMAVAYSGSKILAETEIKGRGAVAQLVAVQSLLSALTFVGKIIFTGRTWFQDQPVSLNFAQFHKVKFEFEHRDHRDEQILKKYRNPGFSKGRKSLAGQTKKSKADPQTAPRECFEFPEIRNVKVRLDGHFQYQRAFYWMGEKWSGMKLQVLGSTQKIEVFAKGSCERLTVFEKLEQGEQSSPGEEKAPWERAQREDSLYRKKSRLVGSSFDSLVLEAIRSGQGVVHTGRIMGYLSLMKSWPYEQLEAVALHCLKIGRRSLKYYRSCLETAHE